VEGTLGDQEEGGQVHYVLPFLDRVSGGPYAPHACAASLCLSLVGRDISMNYPRSRPRLLLPQLILKRAA